MRLQAVVLLFLMAIALIKPLDAQTLSIQQVRAIVDQTAAAYGSPVVRAQVRNVKAIGSLTAFKYGPATPVEEVTFDVVLLRKGPAQVQRIIRQPAGEQRQGSDGIESWNAVAEFTSVPEGGIREFLETQTVRSVDALINFRSTGLSLRDGGTKKGTRIVEAADAAGRTTRYSVDPQTSLITEIQVFNGLAKDLFGNTVELTNSYLFSDFRAVAGIQTPFKIERYENGLKVEEMRFTSVSYNTPITDADFRPRP